MTPEASQKRASDGLAAVEQAGQLLAYLSASLASDPDTSLISLALDGVAVVLAKANTCLSDLAA